MIGVATYPAVNTVCLPLPYGDPSAALVELHKRLNASYKLTHEAMLANMRDQFWAHEPERPLKETLHGIS